MLNEEAIVIRIAGDSGDGMQLVGEQLTICAALNGKDVRTLPDFPAEIRAPAGTVAGISGFQLAMAEQEIFTAGESLQVLVALNPAALKHSLADLEQGGLLIINEDAFRDKDWKKAGLEPEFLEKQQAHYQLLSFPLLSQVTKAVEGIDISHAQAKKTKNFYVLGLVLWLFDLPVDYCRGFLKRKFSRQPELAEANDAALMAGYNFALTCELSRQKFMLGQTERAPGSYRQITGVEAVAMAAACVATGTNTPLLVAGYPITPASAILHECVKLKNYGVEMFQAEDEIAAVTACLGAAFGGRLAMTCTSGPGLDLKSEGIGLGVVSELPLVVIDVQRAGASTGLPTKTGQSDLAQALYGRHGESPLPVLAAISPSDCFNTILEAFRVAVTFMTPVIVLLDAYLANAAEPWKIPDIDTLDLPDIHYNRNTHPFERDEKLARSWNLPGTEGFIYQLGGLEKQGVDGKVSYDADNHQNMVDLRKQKIEGVAKAYPALEVYQKGQAQTLVIGWGSTYGALRSAVKQCHSQGIFIDHLQLKHLNPLPDDLANLLDSYEKVIVAELNSGQLWQLLRSKYLKNIQLISQCNGQAFTVSHLCDALKKEVTHE